MSAGGAARAEYDAKTAALVGRRLSEVRYWDIDHVGKHPRTWDHDDWHHAVMGVELMTDRGPHSAVWTNTFHPYGIEVFATPMTAHVVSGAFGPEHWDASASARWLDRLNTPIAATQTFWEPVTVGPTRVDDVEVSPSYEVDVPIALRLEFRVGPVWMIAAIPQPPDMTDVFVGGDEIMVVFAAERMRQIGFPDSDFLAPSAP